MNIKIITTFPEFFSGVFCSLLGKGIKNNLLKVEIIDLKKYGTGKHLKVDDTPFGGGEGLIVKPDVLYSAISDNLDQKIEKKDRKLILTSARGKLFKQSTAKEIYKNYKEIILICTRYEGVDQRAIDYLQIEELRIGDYVLMGGESASLVMIESIARYIPELIGNQSSIEENQTSIENGFLQFDHYTNPRKWMDIEVPEVIISGNHKKIKEWKLNNSKGKKIG